MALSYEFSIANCDFIDNATCKTRVPIEWLRNKYVEHYDKDGYELTGLEKQLYKCQGFKLINVLNKKLLASEWITIEDDHLYLEHCMILNRCDFSGAALDQLITASKSSRLIKYLLSCKRKWGIDIALDYIGDEDLFEVFHFEFDSYDINEAREFKKKVEDFVVNNDLHDVATRIKDKRDEWSKYEGYHQNLWKAKYLGFDYSERTQKSI